MVVVRRTQYDLDQALAREHILEGLKIAVDNIDEVIKIIRKAEDTPQASDKLQKRFKLSEKQSEAILNMRLAKLTGLEIEKLEEELGEVRGMIKEFREILASKPRRMKILKEELAKLAETYGDERRTEITSDEGEFTIEDLIAEEDMVVTISHSGYIKRTSVTSYKKQRRGGRGNNGATLKDEDFIEHLFVASTHEYILFFTDDGRCFWLKVHEIPQVGRAGKGKPVVNMINVTPDTKISAVVPVREFTDAMPHLCLQGPRSRKMLQPLASQDLSNDAFRYLTAREAAVGPVPCLALRVTYVGELGWELYCPMEFGLRLWDTIWTAGRDHGLLAGGYKAIDSLRLEKGYRVWGADITPDETPYEAGLDFAVKLDKGDFIGREALLEAKERPKRKLVCLVLEDPRSVALGSEPVRLDGSRDLRVDVDDVG